MPETTHRSLHPKAHGQRPQGHLFLTPPPPVHGSLAMPPSLQTCHHPEASLDGLDTDSPPSSRWQASE